MNEAEVAPVGLSRCTWDSLLQRRRPRVLLDAAQLSLARQRAQTTHRAEFESLLELAGTGVNECGANKDYSETAWRLSFLALLSGEKRHAAAAITAINGLLGFPVSGEYFTGARRLKALACAYDWLHGEMDQSLRHRVGLSALAYCQALYDSGEIEPHNRFLGHNINQIPYVLMAAIAIGDEISGTDPLAPKACDYPRGENPADPAAFRYFANVMERLPETLPCYRHFLQQDCFQQSYAYTCTYMGELPYLFQAADVALGTNLFAENAVFQNVVKWWTYAMRDDDTFIRFGDYFCAIPVLHNPAYYRPLAAIAARYRNPLAQWWVKRFELRGAEPDQILFEERADAVAPQSPESLPRTKFFAPMGVAVARGDFAKGTVAAFKCTPLYLHNHGHRDANSFVIYHRGDLAIDSGAYDSYETPHWYNYYIRTIAHNTVVVHDPAEQMISRGNAYANDGGQRFVNEPHFQVRTYDDIFAPAFSDGRIVTYQEAEGYSYVCGDASNCYRPEKLTSFRRHVVFVLDHPSRSKVSMVVLDEIEMANVNLTPRYLLHTMEQPTASGSRIEATHQGGRVTAEVLLPERPVMDVIGGEGNEFSVDGRNYALSRAMPAPNTPGAWRAEVSDPTDRSRLRRFLTMLTVNDAGAAREMPTTLETTGSGWVVWQGDLAVELYRGASVRPAARRVVRVMLEQ